MKTYTASWFTKLPTEILRVGISRGTPRGMTAGYRRMTELNPGPWFNSVPPGEYLKRYSELLAALDPDAVVDKLRLYSDGRDVALLCFESPGSVSTGQHYCHRHIVAQWLNDTAGASVTEYGFPDLDWWAHFRQHNVAPPVFRVTPRLL